MYKYFAGRYSFDEYIRLNIKICEKLKQSFYNLHNAKGKQRTA